jgi:hypothetical protein
MPVQKTNPQQIKHPSPIDVGNIFEVINTNEVIKPISLARRPVFKFVMENINTGEIAILFLNANNTKIGYKVAHDGKFACLYRLTVGKNPKSAYSKAQHLRSHFIGSRFKCETELRTYEKGDLYTRVTEAEPISPVITAERSFSR